MRWRHATRPINRTGILTERNVAYAEAMGEVYRAHRHDLDIAALYADALLNITAWSLWDLESGRPADGARTIDAKDVLEEAMMAPGGMTHPGILHFYIHLMEMSPQPEVALAAADALRPLVPDAGHLVHMPTHIDVLVGDYEQVIVDNERAIAADDRFVAAVGALNFYTLYRAHDHHFRIYGAMFAGRREVALQAAAALEAALPAELLRVEVPPMADWLESFVPMRLHVLVRFGMWEELIAAPLPDDPELYSVTDRAVALRQGRGAGGHRAGRRGRAMSGAARRRRRPRPGVALPVQQPRARHPGDRRARCWTARSPIAVESMTERGGAYATRLSSTTRCPMTSRGGGCSRPGTRMARFCSNRARSRRRPRFMPPTSVSTRRCLAPVAIPTTSGACTATTSAWSRLGRAEDARALAPQLDRAMAQADVAIESSCFCRVG